MKTISIYWSSVILSIGLLVGLFVRGDDGTMNVFWAFVSIEFLLTAIFFELKNKR